MEYFERVVRLIAKNGDRVSQITTFLMMLVIVLNSLGRLIGFPIYGTEDYVSLLSIVLVALTLAYCAVQKGHIQIDLLVSRLSQRSQGIIDSIIHLLSLGLFSIVCWQCIVLALRIMQTGEKSMSALIPLYPFLLIVALGCVFLSLVIIVDLGRSLTKAVKN